jgi:hypothetical protein
MSNTLAPLHNSLESWLLGSVEVLGGDGCSRERVAERP